MTGLYQQRVINILYVEKFVALMFCRLPLVVRLSDGGCECMQSIVCCGVARTGFTFVGMAD